MRLLVSFLLGGALATQGNAQAIRGSVRHALTREPIAYALVSVISADGQRISQSTTDAGGGFLLAWRHDGQIALKTERLGYRTTMSEYFVFNGRDTVQASLFMLVDAIPLEPLIVQDEARLRDISGDMKALYRRKQLGLGHFVTTQMIAESGASQIEDVLRWVPGVMLRSFRGGTGTRAYSTRNLTRPCPMELFLDGRRFRNSAVGVNLVHAQDVAAIEVYRGLSEVPGEFSGDFARCGVIAIWTKR